MLELYQLDGRTETISTSNIATEQTRLSPTPKMLLPIVTIAPFPEQIRLENTNACNAACVMCPRELQ